MSIVLRKEFDMENICAWHISFVHRGSLAKVGNKKAPCTDDNEWNYLYFNQHFSHMSALGF